MAKASIRPQNRQTPIDTCFAACEDDAFRGEQVFSEPLGIDDPHGQKV